MNGKIIYDRYYSINSAQTKEIMVHFILQPRHIFILMLVLGRVQLLNTSIALRCAHGNCLINTHSFIPLLILRDMGIYAIMEGSNIIFYSLTFTKS